MTRISSFLEKLPEISIFEKHFYKIYSGVNNGFWFNFQIDKCDDKNECKKSDKKNCLENVQKNQWYTHVMLDSRVVVSHALVSSVNIQFFDSMTKLTEMWWFMTHCLNGVISDISFFDEQKCDKFFECPYGF